MSENIALKENRMAIQFATDEWVKAITHKLSTLTTCQDGIFQSFW